MSMSMSDRDRELLSVRNLYTTLRTDDGVLRAADGIPFEISRGEVFAVVGESGSGKSVTAMSILRLLPSTADIVADEMLWKGRDLLAVKDDDLRNIRGGEIAMIFQDPLTALNPTK